MNLNKKQVGAMLKIMSKDTTRPILNTGYITEYKDNTVLVFTDGYVLAVLKLDAEVAKPLLGEMVRRNSFEKWYKLATGKSRLDTEELVNIANDDYATNNGYQMGEYPNVFNILPTTEPEGQKVMSFNADYVKNVQDLFDSEGVTLELHGTLSPMVFKYDEHMAIVMPRKK